MPYSVVAPFTLAILVEKARLKEALINWLGLSTHVLGNDDRCRGRMCSNIQADSGGVAGGGGVGGIGMSSSLAYVCTYGGREGGGGGVMMLQGIW
jgi:hypothetical protein